MCICNLCPPVHQRRPWQIGLLESWFPPKMGYVQGRTVNLPDGNYHQWCDQWQVQVRELSESFKPMIARIALLTAGSASASTAEAELCGDLERQGQLTKIWKTKGKQCVYIYIHTYIYYTYIYTYIYIYVLI